MTKRGCAVLVVATMSTWTLLILIGGGWVTYVIAGGFGVAAKQAEGELDDRAGFSFLPELLVFPALFFGVAKWIDAFAYPWGSRGVGAFHGLLALAHLASIIQDFARIRTAIRRRDAEKDSSDKR
jgi:hypothetical protein